MTAVGVPGIAATAIDREALRARSIALERSAARARARRAAVGGWGTTAVISLAMLAAWEIAAQAWLTRLGVLAAPSTIIRSLVDDAGLYARNVQVTSWVAARGWFCPLTQPSGPRTVCAWCFSMSLPTFSDGTV